MRKWEWGEGEIKGREGERE